VSSGGEGFFQAGGSALCQGAAAAKRFLPDSRPGGPASPSSWLCRQLGLARSGYYAWRQRQENPGSRAREDAVITAEIQECSSSTVASTDQPRVHQEWLLPAARSGGHRVARLMRRAQLQAKTRKAFRPCRKASSSVCGATENLLQQDFQPSAPNRSWAGDITYIRTKAGWRYLAVWIDLFSRRVRRMETRQPDRYRFGDPRRSTEPSVSSPGRTREAADPIRTRAANTGLLDYRDLLEKHEIVCSMSARAAAGTTRWWRASSSTLKFELDLDDDRKDLDFTPATAKTIWPSDRGLLQP